MLRNLAFALVTALFLAGCSGYQGNGRLRMETLPERYSQFDLQMAWDTTVTGHQTVVEGVVKNVRYAYMNELEIWVAALDGKGRLLARSVAFVIPMQLRMDETAEFTLKLPVAVEPGDRLHFTYRYFVNEGGDLRPGSGLDTGFPWVQSFDAVVPAH